MEQKVIEAIKQTVTTADAATSEGDNKASHPVPPIPTKETDQVWKVGVDRRLVALDRALVTLNAGIQHSVPQHRLSSRTSGRRSSLSKSAILRAQATLNKREHEQARAEVGRLQDQMKRVLNNIAMITREVRENRATTSPRSSPGPTVSYNISHGQLRTRPIPFNACLCTMKEMNRWRTCSSIILAASALTYFFVKPLHRKAF